MFPGLASTYKRSQHCILPFSSIQAWKISTSKPEHSYFLCGGKAALVTVGTYCPQSKAFSSDPTGTGTCSPTLFCTEHSRVPLDPEVLVSGQDAPLTGQPASQEMGRKQSKLD